MLRPNVRGGSKAELAVAPLAQRAVLQPPSYACVPNSSNSSRGPRRLHFLSRPRRATRAHEWSHAKAVTFIVTLAASGSVTLAAREAGMSRKSAYALKARDPAFAAVWNAAAGKRKRNEAREVNRPSVSPGQGDSRAHAALSVSSFGQRDAVRRAADAYRDRLFDSLARLRAAGAAQPR